MTDSPPLLAGDELTQRVYLLLLRQSAPRRSTLLKEGFTEEELASALSSLELRGLVNATRRDVIEVYPPDTTLPAYAADLERQARSTRSAVEGLTHMYNEARTVEGQSRASREVALLATLDDVDAAFFRAARRAEKRVVRLVARSERMDKVVMRHAESIIAARPTTSRPQLERLLVFEQSILEVEGAFSALETMRADGIEVRITPHLAFSVLAVDRTTAVIDVTHLDAAGGGSLYIQHRQLAGAFMDMCLGLFAASTPLPRSASGGSLARLHQRDGQIIALLAAGASDLTIARQLAVSQRTVERRVRAIMEELGATTRFQAGVTAVRREFL